MAVRLKDVAEAAQVSIALVSNYVNGKSTARMSNATRDRIDEALRALDYRPNLLAQMLRRGGESRKVGIITSGLKNEVTTRTLIHLQEIFLEHNYTLMIYHTKNEVGLLRTGYQEMLRSGCAGVIAHGQRWHIGDFPLPQVIMSSGERLQESLPEIFCDYRPGVSALLDHLETLGHKKVLFITLKLSGTTCRYRTFTERFGSENVFTFSSPQELTPEKVREMLLHAPDATAAFCSNDLLALALRESLCALGVKVPEEFSVAGFDNTQLSELCLLTTVDQALERRCRSAANALLNLIEKRCEPVEYYIPAELIVRNSCAQAKISRKESVHVSSN